MKHFAFISVTEVGSLDDSVRTRETFYNNRTLVVRLFGMPVFKLHRSLVNEHVPKIQKCLEPCDHHQD